MAVLSTITTTLNDYTINYSYELTAAQTHEGATQIGAADALTGQVDILVTDASGDTATGSLSVEVHDDGPAVTVDRPELTVKESQSVSGILTPTYGADGASSADAVAVTIE